MTPERKENLEKQGWKSGSYAEFLELSEEEKADVEAKLAEMKQAETPETTNDES